MKIENKIISAQFQCRGRKVNKTFAFEEKDAIPIIILKKYENKKSILLCPFITIMNTCNYKPGSNLPLTSCPYRD